MQAAVAVVVMVILGRIVLRPMFRMMAGVNSPESFVAVSLLVSLGASIATAAAGLSMAMAALIEGLLLAETEYRRQIEVTIEPFKRILLGVFLISVGMSIDLLRNAPALLALIAAGAALSAVKALIVTCLGRVRTAPRRSRRADGVRLRLSACAAPSSARRSRRWRRRPTCAARGWRARRLDRAIRTNARGAPRGRVRRRRCAR